MSEGNDEPSNVEIETTHESQEQFDTNSLPGHEAQPNAEELATEDHIEDNSNIAIESAMIEKTTSSESLKIEPEGAEVEKEIKEGEIEPDQPKIDHEIARNIPSTDNLHISVIPQERVLAEEAEYFEFDRNNLEKHTENQKPLLGDDNEHPVSLFSRLLESPIPSDYEHTFEATEDIELRVQEDLKIGLSISRDVSMANLEVTIDVQNADVAPRPFTPVKTNQDLSKLNSSGIEVEQRPVDTAAESGQIEESTEKDSKAEVRPQVEIDRAEVIKQICAELEKKDQLSAKNEMLQNKLADHFRKKRLEEARDTEKSSSDQDQRYSNCISSLNDLRQEYNNVNVSNNLIIEDYKAKLREKITEVDGKSEQFYKYKRTVAQNAENSRTGKPLPQKTIDTLENTEKKKEFEVTSVRLENIKLRNKLRRHEQLLKQKEELADGLHLIDFEQLKIENQTYNEKIEERNEELLKLKKKITNVVQVLTHVKEKLQFVQCENKELKIELRGLEENVSKKRDVLPVLKSSRDKLKASNTIFKQKNGLLGNNDLLFDYGSNVDETKEIKKEIEELQQKYSKLVSETVHLKRKMQKSNMLAQMSTAEKAVTDK